MQTVPQHDNIDSSSEDGTQAQGHANMVPVPSSVHVDGPANTNTYTSSHIDDSTLVTVISSKSSIPPSHVSPSRPGSPSSPNQVDGVPPLSRVKRSRSISSHSSSSDTDSDDERASKRHHSDSDEESVIMTDERMHEPVILKYDQHAIRVLMTNDGTRVVVAKDFLLLTGISKENCARTTKNLVEGRDKRMMHVPSNYCMNKGQQAVVLTLSGLSQLLVTSRRLKQSSVLQAWIKQTLVPVLRGEHTPQPSPTPIPTPTPTTQHNPHNTPSTSPTQTASRRTIVVAKRSARKSPSTSPVMTPRLTPSPRSLSRDMSPSSSNSDDSRDEKMSFHSPHSPLHDLSAAAAAMLNIAPISMPKPFNISTSAHAVHVDQPSLLGFPMSTGFSNRVPTFSYRRTPLMGMGMGMGMGRGMGTGMVLPRFTHPAAQQLGLGVRAVGA